MAAEHSTQTWECVSGLFHDKGADIPNPQAKNPGKSSQHLGTCAPAIFDRCYLLNAPIQCPV